MSWPETSSSEEISSLSLPEEFPLIHLAAGAYRAQVFLPEDILEETFEWTEESSEHNYYQSLRSENSVCASRSPGPPLPCTFPEPEWKSLVRSVLQEHPMGLTRSRLKDLIKESSRTRMKQTSPVSLKDSCPYDTLESLMLDNPGFLEEVSFRGMQDLFFLANPERPIDMMRLLARLRHRLQIILTGVGILPAQAFCEHLFKEFGLQLDPEDWGFNNAEALVAFMLSVYPGSYTRCIPVVRLDGASTSMETVLVYTNGTCPKIAECVKAEDEKIKATKETKPMKEYQGNFVRFGDKLDYIGDFVEESDIHQCYVGKIYSPLDFYVHLAEFLDELEHFFQKTLNKYYVPARQGGILAKIPPKLERCDMIPGMFAAAYIDQEWFRCVIKKFDEERERCEVFSIDFGFVANVPSHHLRRLHCEVFRKMKAQAVNCRLEIHPFYSKYVKAVLAASRDHKHDVRRMLMKIVKDKRICATFKRHVFLPEENNFIWEVELSIIRGHTDRYLEVGESVWDLFLKELEGKYPLNDYVSL